MFIAITIVFLGPPAKKTKSIDSLIDDIKESVTDIMGLSKDSFPLGLKKLVIDAFVCTICGVVPINPPIMVTKCCKAILGCKSCVNEWFSGEDALTKPCPKCKQRRGFGEVMHLRGLDNFLIGLQKALGETEEESDVAEEFDGDEDPEAV